MKSINLDILSRHTVWIRKNDPYVHIGPPKGLAIPTTSPIFQTRCGLEAQDGVWEHPHISKELQELCPECRKQAGV